MAASHIKAVTGNEFEALIKDNEIVFVDFWAEWCAPCKQFAQIYEKTASQFEGKIVFSSVNIEHEKELAEVFQIRSIPHLMVFKQGIAIYSEAGSLPSSVLEELAQQALQADMSEIRQQMEDE